MLAAIATTGHRLERLASSYWQQSRRPLASLILLAPLLLLYELGIFLLGNYGVRNGADLWLRWVLSVAGLGHGLLLPALTILALLVWQYASRQRWDVPAMVIVGMVAESICWAVALLLAAQLSGLLLSLWLPGDALWHVTAAWGFPSLDRATRLVSYLGAGIYEEVLFRLLLLPALAFPLRFILPKQFARAAAIAGSSLLFAAAHHLGAPADAVQWTDFGFRFAAGVFFALLFVYRGFGIAASAHAGYDMLVGLPLLPDFA